MKFYNQTLNNIVTVLYAGKLLKHHINVTENESVVLKTLHATYHYLYTTVHVHCLALSLIYA